MSASISLALTAKIKLIMESSGSSSGSKFISFVPAVRKLDFKFSELDFFGKSGGAETDANILELNRSAFAEIVNQVPEDNIVFTPSDNGLLWDIFEQNIIDNAITARTELSETEKAKLAEAHLFCDENFASYRSFKNTLDQYQLDYKQAKCSLEYATGEEKNKLQKEWDDFREKMLTDRIQIAEDDLKISGKQAEVLSALNIINNLETKNGIDTLKTEIKFKVDSLFSKGVPNRAGTEYLYTDFSPLGSFDEGSSAWNQIKLYSSEIESLCKNAPSDLKNLYQNETAVNNIESISFEYAVVSVVREWFSESFICSSNWKFANETTVPVSDGNIPAMGMIPAFINKIICIRKLSYSQKTAGTGPVKMTLAIISANPIKDYNIKKAEPRKPLPPRTGPFIFGRRIPVSVALAHTRTARVSASAVTVVDHRAKNKNLLAWRNTRIAKFKNPMPVKPVPQATPISANSEHSFDGIKFIAFECKRLPLSPNPGAGLIWD